MAGCAFLARYDGECVECDGSIYAGEDRIVMTDDGAVHEECAPDSVEPDLPTFPL